MTIPTMQLIRLSQFLDATSLSPRLRLIIKQLADPGQQGKVGDSVVIPAKDIDVIKAAQQALTKSESRDYMAGLASEARTGSPGFGPSPAAGADTGGIDLNKLLAGEDIPPSSTSPTATGTVPSTAEINETPTLAPPGENPAAPQPGVDRPTLDKSMSEILGEGASPAAAAAPTAAPTAKTVKDILTARLTDQEKSYVADYLKSHGGLPTRRKAVAEFLEQLGIERNAIATPAPGAEEIGLRRIGGVFGKFNKALKSGVVTEEGIAPLIASLRENFAGNGKALMDSFKTASIGEQLAEHAGTIGGLAIPALWMFGGKALTGRALGVDQAQEQLEHESAPTASELVDQYELEQAQQERQIGLLQRFPTAAGLLMGGGQQQRPARRPEAVRAGPTPQPVGPGAADAGGNIPSLDELQQMLSQMGVAQ